jgi:ubiquinone/menaquinone biosynthesis C-methylase UbiE
MSSLSKLIPIEGIPYPFSRLYTKVAAESPYLRDFYKQVALEISREINSGKILDIGTGPGFLPIEVAKILPGVEVVGIDLSKDMVEMARKNAAKANLPARAKFEVEDANQMSFEDSYFNFVVSTGSLHHWKRPLRVLNEIYRVLKPGSQAWIYDSNREASAEEAAKIKRKYGYLLGALTIRGLKFHSTKLEEAYNVLNDAGNRFKKYGVEAEGLQLKIILPKV